MPESSSSSSPVRLRTGSKISLLVAIPFLALAAYFLWTPITLQSPDNGQIYNCGTAAAGPETTFQRNVCGDLPKTNKVRSIASAATGILIALGGVAGFGLDGTRPRPRFDEDEDLDEDQDAPFAPTPASTASVRDRDARRRSFEDRATSTRSRDGDKSKAKSRSERRSLTSRPLGEGRGRAEWDEDWDGDDDSR